MSTNAESINSMTHRFSVQLAEIFGNSEEDIYHTCIFSAKTCSFMERGTESSITLGTNGFFQEKMIGNVKNLLVLEILFSPPRSLESR